MLNILHRIEFQYLMEVIKKEGNVLVKINNQRSGMRKNNIINVRTTINDLYSVKPKSVETIYVRYNIGEKCTPYCD